MDKYGTPNVAIEQLIKLGICQSEAEAREKVASGQADGLIKEAMKKQAKPEDTDAAGPN